MSCTVQATGLILCRQELFFCAFSYCQLSVAGYLFSGYIAVFMLSGIIFILFRLSDSEYITLIHTSVNGAAFIFSGIIFILPFQFTKLYLCVQESFSLLFQLSESERFSSAVTILPYRSGTLILKSEMYSRILCLSV